MRFYWNRRPLNWGGRDKDRIFGPFLFMYEKRVDGRGAYINLSIKSSGRESPGYIRLSIGPLTFMLNVGELLKPIEYKVYPPSWDDETKKRLGRDYYIDYVKQEYGFHYDHGYLNIKYGASTMDSATDKSKGWFMPWIEWRIVSERLYDVDMDVFAEFEGDTIAEWHKKYEARERCPTINFFIKDYDGEIIQARTRVEGCTRRWGTKRHWWMGYLRKPRITQTLEMTFDSEVGKRKGSWKGGMVGTSITMLPGENHKKAFMRWCEAEKGVTFMHNGGLVRGKGKETK